MKYPHHYEKKDDVVDDGLCRHHYHYCQTKDKREHTRFVFRDRGVVETYRGAYREYVAYLDEIEFERLRGEVIVDGKKDEVKQQQLSCDFDYPQLLLKETVAEA